MKRTTVVNIKTAARGSYVYIGRAGRGKDGTFGNPIIVGKKCQQCRKVHRFPSDTLRCFAHYFADKLNHDREFRGLVGTLKGKRLGCFCTPKPCHGQIIAAYCDSYWTEHADGDLLFNDSGIADLACDYKPEKGEPWRCGACSWEGKPKGDVCGGCSSEDIFPCNDGGWPP
jgi:hypothetical protein